MRRWFRKKRARPLQIREVVAAAEEHLRAVALPGLERRYLPGRLEIRVSQADLAVLRPFREELERALRSLADGMAVQSTSRATEPLAVEIVATRTLREGEAPLFEAGFPPGCRRVEWTAPSGGASRGASDSSSRAAALDGGTVLGRGREAPADEAAVATWELRVTAANAAGTALQSSLEFEFGASVDGGPDEPRDDLAPPPEESEGGPSPERLPGPRPSPAARRILERLDLLDPAVRPATLLGTGATKLEGGVLLLGRVEGAAHWVPPGAPPNLSTTHLAFFLADGALQVVDLDSTNGTRLGPRRLEAGAPVPVSGGETLEIGSEGRCRIEIRRVDRAGTRRRS